ncbi:hypothetical protein [Rubrivirga sp. IMCC45206]|uniref:hypothetical protein n=1 Tax=Rubrivirga sp. IMCC45206 TaxID=3391614 RepID=UPI00398FFF60
MTLALLLLLQLAPQAEADRLFRLGVDLVAEGDTSGAVAAWQGARATGWASAAVEHNLGTVALARGETGPARLHLERAARLDPADPAIARNVALARARAGAPPPTAAVDVWRRLVGIVTPLGVVGLALALVFGALGLALGGRTRASMGLGAVAAVAVLAAAWTVRDATQPLGVALADAVVVEARSPDAPAVARLRAGETAQVGAAVDGWRAVRVGRAEGWAPADAVAPL